MRTRIRRVVLHMPILFAIVSCALGADAPPPIRALLITERINHGWMDARPDAHALTVAFSATDKGGSGADEPGVFETKPEQAKGTQPAKVKETKPEQVKETNPEQVKETNPAKVKKKKPEKVKKKKPEKVKGTKPGEGKEASPVAGDAGVLPAIGPPAADADAALKAVESWRFGDGRKPLLAVEGLVQAAAADPAKRRALAAKLGAMLHSDATREAKEFACRQLSLIASDDEIPLLVSLLNDKQLGFAARFALQRIPGDEALEAMRAALKSTEGANRIGLLLLLGERRDKGAVAAISEMLKNEDAKVRTAAIAALGRIGDGAAAKALEEARGAAPSESGADFDSALLRCAESLRAEGRTEVARAIYAKISGESKSGDVRSTAFAGLIACDKEKVPAAIREALRGADRAKQVAAIRAIRGSGDKALLRVLVETLSSLPLDLRIQGIGALPEGCGEYAISALGVAAASDNADERRAAADALGRAATPGALPILARLAAKEKGSDCVAARAALIRLRGEEIETAMADLIGKSDAPVARELLAALAARGSRMAAKTLLKAVQSNDAALRKEAIKAMSNLPPEESVPALLGLIGNTRDADEARAVEDSLSAVYARRGKGKNAGRDYNKGEVDVAPILAALTGADAGARAALFRVLGKAGGPKALEALRSGLKDSDIEARRAAVRALSDWETDEPLEDLLGAAQGETKALALLGFATVSNKAKDADPVKMAGLFERALRIADTPECLECEKALIFALAKFPTPKSLELSLKKMSGASAPDESALAALQIAEALRETHPVEARAAIVQVLATSKNSTVLEKANAAKGMLDKPVILVPQGKVVSPATPQYSWRQDGSMLALLNGDRTIWQFNYAKEGGKPYFHPLALLDGTELTRLSPPDHKGHRGLWFSWKFINGVHYWSEKQKTGEGQTELVEAILTPQADYGASIELSLTYHPSDKPAVLTEKRSIHIHPPDAAGGYEMDWTSVFTAADQDVNLDRTPPLADEIPGSLPGTPGGGYAGLGVRLTTSTLGWAALNSEGIRGAETDGKRARWYDFSGALPDGRLAGIAFFDHPANPNHPTPWRIYTWMPYITPAVLYDKPMILPAGKSMTLKYRILVHAGGADAERLEKEWKAFAGER